MPTSQPYEGTDTSQPNGYPTTYSNPSAGQFHPHPDSAGLKSVRTHHLPEPVLLQPNRVNLLGRKNSDLSGVGSESDSLLDLYGSYSGNRSGVGSVHYAEGNPVNGEFHLDEDDPENSRWIHRDKLARIESEEMQRAGIKIGSTSHNHPGSKRVNGRDRERSTEHHRDGTTETDVPDPRDTQRPPASPEPADDAQEEPMSFELRRPEEVAADVRDDKEMLSNPQVRRLGRKTSHSKIPLSKSSPIPIPQDYIARHTPAHRHGSSGWGSVDEDSLVYRKARSRSHSVGSQILLDDPEEGGRNTPTMGGNSALLGSSAKPKGIAKPVSGLQKPRVSASREGSVQAKPRSRSAQVRDSPSQRPGTRSGDTPPGNQVKKPEGDPPWLATMYKPDPRLPPEQQLLPTVAKRLQQEQWEREGKAGSVYDRELKPVSIHDEETPEMKPLPTHPPEKRAEEAEWPLKSEKVSEPSGGEPVTNGAEHGGYKVIPTLESSPNVHPPALSPAIPSAPVPTEQPEKAKKEGCGCCILM